MIILGLNAYHGDASACVLRGGVLVAAAEEARFRRLKHWAGFPAEAIRYCLHAGGLKLGEVAHVAVNQDGRANLLHKLGYLVTRRPDLGLVLDRIRNKRKRAGVGAELEACFPGEHFAGTVHEVEHHHAHRAWAYLVSPFVEGVAVWVDGLGDFASAGWGVERVQILPEREVSPGPLDAPIRLARRREIKVGGRFLRCKKVVTIRHSCME